MQVTAVVITFDSAQVVGDCLRSLEGQGVHVVVVDNASRDGTSGAVAVARPDATWLSTGQNAGFAAAINRGCREVPDDHAVLVLNPDVRLMPGAVAALMNALDGAGICVPRLQSTDGTTAHSLRRTPSVRRALAEAVLGGRRAARWGIGEVVAEPAAYESQSFADWATGAAWLISPACRRDVGAWDESFFLYSEETDYALRAAAHGHVLRFVPGATAVHIGGESGTNPRLYALLTANRLRAYRMRRGILPALPFALALLAGELVRCAGGNPVHRAALRGLLLPRAQLLREAGAGPRPPGPA